VLADFETWAANKHYDRDPVTGQYIIGQSASDRSTSEGDWFGSDLSYSVAWRLDNFDDTSKLKPGTSPQLCDAVAHLTGTAAVRAKVLGVWADVFNASANLDTPDADPTLGVPGTMVDYSADIRVLGVPFYSPSGSSDLSVAVALDQSRTDTLAEEVAVIPVLGVPVTLKAGATGTLGFHGAIDNPKGGAAIQRNCADSSAPILIGVHGVFKPFASLDGFASASIDLGIAEGGVKGDVTLLRLELPLDVKIAIGLVPPPNQQGAPQAELDVDTALNLDFSTLDGRISAFLDYPLGSVEKTIASWSGLHFSHNVFDRSSSVPLDYIKIIDKLGAP
jgi:hypothetical protein